MLENTEKKLGPCSQTYIESMQILSFPMNNFVADLIIQRITFEMEEGANIVDQLHKKGYNDIFEVSNDLLKSVRNGYYYQTKDFNIDELYILEDVSNSLKGLGLFALRHRIEKRKGIFVGFLH